MICYEVKRILTIWPLDEEAHEIFEIPEKESIRDREEASVLAWALTNVDELEWPWYEL